MRRLSIAAAALILSVASAYASGTRDRSAGGYAHPEFLVSTEDLSARLGKGNLVILDTRKPEDYSAGHIPGAVSLPPSKLDQTLKLATGAEVPAMVKSADEVQRDLRAAGVSRGSGVVIYDTGGSSLAARLWWVLDYYGHKNIAILDGGFAAWQREGGPVTSDVAVVQPGDFRPVADPAKIADYDYVKARIGTESTAVCDALSAKSYKEGAIEKTINLPSSDQFGSESRLLKPAQELSAALLQLNMSPDKEIIFYCGAGYAAAVDYFVARTLGYRNVRLYDGSLADWTARGEILVPSGGM